MYWKSQLKNKRDIIIKMFRKNKGNINELFEELETLNEEQLITLYIKIISRGETEIYKEIYIKRPLCDKELLEYALVYGRYNILEIMLEDNSNIITHDYDPFLFENCDPDVTSDINDNSWWSNDEHERYIINKKGINHAKCFEILKQYGKKIDITNVKKWLNLSNNQVKYWSGNYFPLLNDITIELIKNNGIVLNIPNVINLLENIIDYNLLLKIIKTTFKAQEIIEQLKTCQQV